MPSLFDPTITIDTPGVAWLATTDPSIVEGDTVEVVDGTQAAQRASQAIDSSYIVGGGSAYFTFIRMFAPSHFALGRRIHIFLGTTASESGSGSGPQFTDGAESSLGLAIQAGGSTFKILFSNFVAQDPTETYLWNVGSAITQTLINNIGGASEAKSILVDTSNPAIDWDNLQTVDPAPTVPEVDDQNAVYRVAYDLVLPEASFSGAIQYSVAGLPAGLSFDATTRTIHGTPTGIGATTITYTANGVGAGSTSVTFELSVVSEVSLFDPAITNDTSAGVAVKTITNPSYDSGTGLATAIDSSDVATRSSDQIDTTWIENGSVAYLVGFYFNGTAGTLGVGATADAHPTNVSDDTFTAMARERLGIAVRTDDGEEYKWTLAGLLQLDTTDPHTFSAALMASAGSGSGATLRQNVGQADELTIVLVDRMHKDIDWDNLQFNPAPSVASIPNIELDPGATLDQLLPPGAGVQTPLTRTVSGLASWMTYNAVTGRITGTAPLEQSTTTITFTITDNDGDTAVTTFDVVVRLGIGSFNRPAGHILIDAALIETGHTSFVYRDDDPDTVDAALDSGQILDGSLFPADDYRISRIRYRAPNIFQLNDEPSSEDISAFFVSGDGNDITIHLQDEDGVVSLNVADATVQFSNANNIRWNVPTAFSNKLAGLSQGDRFILAFTRAVPNTDPVISITTPASLVDGGSSTPIAGTVTDALDDDGDVVITATTSIGTVSTPVNTDGSWDFNLTAPPLAATQQVMDVTVTATDSGGRTATATRTWTVRANQVPTVMINTPGGAQEPGSSLSLSATTEAPESGQSVSESWEVTTNNATLTGAATSSPTITFPAATTAQQTVTVRVTATDPFGLTATDTVTFTIRSAGTPAAPAAPTLSNITIDNITATFSNPASELPIAQHDLRWREVGTADWTERNGVALPYTITSLSDNLTYEVQGRVRSAGGTSAWSPSSTATTAVNTSPVVTFTTPAAIVEGSSTTTISGTVSDNEDDNGDVVVTATTTLGTVSTPVNTNGTWAIILTAPTVAVAQQTMAVTIIATDSNGASVSIIRNWAVRANRNPTVVIGTTGGAREPGSTLTLSATASPPESGQSVSVAWDVTTTNATLVNPSTLTPIITFPTVTQAQQTVIVRVTATDELDATATDTVAFVVRAARFPSAPPIPQFGAVTLDSITVLFTDPSSELPITQRDARYRVQGGTWTVRNNATFPLVISGLSENTTYEVQLRARSAAGIGTWSNTGSIATSANTAPTIAFTTTTAVVEGLSVTAISGTVSDTEDNNGDVAVTASTTIGTVSTPVNTNGTWTLNLTAPAVAAGQQTMSVTVRATDSGGLGDTATRDWIVRANSVPTIMFDRPGQNVEPGESIIIRAITTPPEAGQSVSVAWQALDGGSVSPGSGATTTFTVPTGQSITTAYRVRATATDNLGATATQIITFTVVVLNAPTIRITTPPSVVAGESVLAIAGTVDDVEDDNAVLRVTLRTTLGSLSPVSRIGSNWSTTLTAPSSTVVPQIMTLSATVTDSDGLFQTATRSWTVASSGGVLSSPIRLRIYNESESISFGDDYITIAEPGGRATWFMAPSNVNAQSLIPYSIVHAPAVAERTRDFLSENIPLWVYGYNDYDSLKQGINDIERLIERANRGKNVWVEYDDQRGDDNLWRSPVVAGVLSLTNQTFLNFRENKAALVASVTRQPWWEGPERIVNLDTNTITNGGTISILPDMDGVVATPLKLTITKSSGVTSSGVRMHLFKKTNTQETPQNYNIGSTNSMSFDDTTRETVTTMATVNMSALQKGWYDVWLGGSSSSNMRTLRSASVWRFVPGNANRWMTPEGRWTQPGRIGNHQSRYTNLGRVYVGQRTHVHIQSWALQNHSSPSQTIYMMPTDGYRGIYVAGSFANSNTLIDNGTEEKIEGTQAASTRAVGEPLSMIPGEYSEIVVLTEDSTGGVSGNYTLTAHHRPRRSTL